MRRVAVLGLAALSLSLAGCWSDNDVTGTTNACAVNLYNPYNPKVMDQCVNVCIKCDHGNMTTCTTSCTLKGAR